MRRTDIDTWTKEDEMFVETVASKHVIQCLQKESCVTLSGPSGVGKSFISRHTALLLQKDGYEIILVDEPEDISTYYQPGKKTVFVVDDICGNFIANQQQVENWRIKLPKINRVIAEKCCKIILCCRLHVYNDYRFKRLTPFTSCECNLISDKLGLTLGEKTDIAIKHIGASAKDIIDESKNTDCFPILCSLYHKAKMSNINNYFSDPFKVYRGVLDTFENKPTACGLALCVIFNNQLNETWFQDSLTDDTKHIKKAACDACGINTGTSRKKLKDALDTLVDTFICKDNGIYRTKHDIMLDFLVHYFGAKMICLFIDHADSGLIHKHFIWREPLDEKNSNIDFIIEIPEDRLESYLNRLINDWSAGNVSAVFDNINMKLSSFRERLLRCLQKLGKSHQIELVNKNKDAVLPENNFGSGDPLILSCFYGYTNMVDWMVKKDVDVNWRREDGVTGLFKACQNGHTDIVQLLLDKGSQVNLCSKDCVSPLKTASENGHTKVVELLLEKSPELDRCDDVGCTALFEASHNGHTAIVKLLLDAKADCNICVNGLEYVIHALTNFSLLTLEQTEEYLSDWLVENKSPEVTEYGKRKPIDPFEVLAGSSPLHMACFMGRIDVVRSLLCHNANINITKESGITPLYYACEVGHKDIVQLLLDEGANTKLRTFDDKSPLNIATENGHNSIVVMLTEHRTKEDPHSS